MSEITQEKKQSPKKGKGKKKEKVTSKVKNQIISGSIIISLSIAGIIGGFFLNFNIINESRGTLTVSYDGFWVNDTLIETGPRNNRVLSTKWVIDQIAEGLFEIEFIGDSSHIIPNLALEGIWSSDALNLTCSLRQDVKFHDNTPFNATSVKHTFDRFHNLLNNMTNPEIWYHYDGLTILNRTEIIDEYTVKFVLNRPYVPFKAMLCQFQTYILSPNTTPLNDFIDTDSQITGTGPFKLESSTWIPTPLVDSDSENFPFYAINTTLLPNSEYWGETPDLDKLIFKICGSDEERYNLMMSGEIQFTYLWPYHLTPEKYTDYGFTLNYLDTQYVNYIWFRNNLINATMRKALSYAFNYSNYLEHEMVNWEGGVIRARSPISKGIPYSNWRDFKVPYFNITIARQALKDVNWNGTAGVLTADDNMTVGNDWENLVTTGNPLATYNFTYIISDTTAQFVLTLMTESFKQIGVQMNPIPITWPEYWVKMPWSHFEGGGWAPVFDDPASNINILYSSKSDGFYNIGNVNDTLVQSWMEQGLIETKDTARAQIYYNIQKRLIEEVYPVMWTYTERYCNVYGPGLGGINENIAYKTLFKNAYFKSS